LVINGEQGSAKSTLCKMGRALIDPNVAPLRRPPRDERDLAIAAGNGWVVGYDNLSGIQPHLSDALCSLATGGGFATRELYSDDEEKLFCAMRPVLINGIEDVVTRPDLLDRALTLTLPTIPDDRRREEDELWQEFERRRPRILGALLTAVSAALRNKPSVRLTSKPRMADFASWAVAAESALGWPAGGFLAAYLANRDGSNAVALESSVVAQPVLTVVEKQTDGIWHGTVKELLAELDKVVDEATRKGREWPTSSRKLGGELRRLAPVLRRAGIDVTFHDRTRTGVPVTLERSSKTSSPSTPCSPGSSGAPPVGVRGEHDVLVSPARSPSTDSEVIEWTG
jgi:hypothetical protein